MFCDLVGSTAMSEQLDPEVMRDVLRSYREACATVVERYEGRVARYIGDGILIYFGYPQAHEDDARRAVCTGLEILGGLKTLSARLEGEIGISIAARLGIHTGLVVAGDLGSGPIREEMAIVGEAPNVAARLQGLAEPGTLLISAATQQLVDGLFSFKDLGRQSLKGMSQPLAVFQVLGESDAASPFEATARRGLFPFVGRDRELSVLLDRWQRALDGAGQVVLLSGEAGIGKSRLIRDFREKIAAALHIPILCYCSPYHHHSAFYPIIEQFERGLRLKREDSPAEKLDKLDALMTRVGLGAGEDAAVLAAFLSLANEGRYPALSLNPRQMKARAMQAAADIIVRLAGQRPVLMVVEDVHWIDPSSLEFLSLLTERLRGARILLLVSHRPDMRLAWEGASHIHALGLDRLPSENCGRMITSIAGGKSIPAKVQAEIVAKCDGVPLFVEELTKTVLESGLLAETDEGYELAGGPSHLAIPSSLKDSLMARLDRLGKAKEVAQLAAVVGRRFAPALLRAVSPLTPKALTAALSLLTAAQLVYRPENAPQELFEFKHALVQDAAYESLLRSTRARHHAQIARALEERFPDTVANEPELLAHHYTKAGLKEQAIKHWQRAGQRALERAGSVEALVYLDKAVELLTTLPQTAERDQQELMLLISRGLALTATRSYGSPDVGDNFARAHELCRRLGDVPQIFPVLHGLYRFYLVRAELNAALETTEQLLKIAKAADNPTLMMEAHQAQSFSLGFKGELRQAQGHYEQCLALFDPERLRGRLQLYSTDTAASVLCLGALIAWLQGYPDRAATVMEQALARAGEIGHAYTSAWVFNFAAVIHQIRGEVDATRRLAEECVRHSKQHEFPFWLAGGRIMRASSVVAAGEQTEEALAEASDGLAGWRQTGAVVFSPYYLSRLVEAYRMLGRAAEGLGPLTDMIAAVQVTGERWWEPELHRLKGELLRVTTPEAVATGEAEASLQHAIALARSQGARSLELRAVMGLAELWNGQGRRGEARELATASYRTFEEGFATADLCAARRLIDRLA